MFSRKLFSYAACLALMALLLPSCKKAIEYFEDHPDAYVPPCRITHVRLASWGNPADFIASYDAKGNLKSLVGTYQGPTTGHDQYFRYDKQGRLSDYMVTYSPSLYAVLWHKYFYAKPNYVIDTTMAYTTGNVLEPSPIAKYTAQYRIEADSLDKLGRIVEIWAISTDSPNTRSPESTFVYDANGNLTPRSPELSYDNKVNPYRTSKTWQFVYQDYSRNNLQHPGGSFTPQYNDFGLPLKLDNLEQWFIYPFFEENYGPEIAIDYACDVPKGPVIY